METLLQDIRYSLRMLRKNPGFTAIAVLTLALGIGANSSMFSLINAVLLRPLSFKVPDQLVLIRERRPSSGVVNIPVAGREFFAWREKNHVFEQSAIYTQGESLTLTGGEAPEEIKALRVSADYFTVLGVTPASGRTFSAEENQVSDSRVAVLSYGLWQRRFGSDPNLVGNKITLNDQGYMVIGVMPPLELAPDLWVPINLPLSLQQGHEFNVIARLKTDVTLRQAQAELTGISAQLEQEYRDNVDHKVQVVALQDEVVGNVRPALLILFGAVGFVLLIACANVANLMLVRAASRQKEIAIRTALGATRTRLICQSLTDSLLLALMGGGVGLLLALWVNDLIPKIEAANIPRLEKMSVDGRVLAATVGFSFLAGIITGLVPALQGSRPDLTVWLNEGTRTSAGPRRRQLGSLLVVLEIALSLVLLVGAGLMIKSFARLVNVDPGFNPDNILTMKLNLPESRYPKAEQQMMFYERLLEQIKTLPGVDSAGATSRLPLGGGDSWSPFSIQGRPAPPPGQEHNAAFRVISPDYFSAMKIPLREGRYFTEADDGRAPVVIINERMAHLFWPDEGPVGQHIRADNGPWLMVVGVVGDVHHTGLAYRPNPEMYLPYQQRPRGSMTVTIRVLDRPVKLAAAVRAQVEAVDKDMPTQITTMEGVFSRSVGRWEFNTLLLSVFGVIALILAVVGVFGVVNYSVAQRTHEIGIRVALGAQRRDILKLIITQGMILALLGIGIGLIGAFALTRSISGLLYDVSPTDSGTFVVVSLFLAGAALLACYLPARRATKVDPITAMRDL